MPEPSPGSGHRRHVASAPRRAAGGSTSSGAPRAPRAERRLRRRGAPRVASPRRWLSSLALGCRASAPVARGRDGGGLLAASFFMARPRLRSVRKGRGGGRGADATPGSAAAVPRSAARAFRAATRNAVCRPAVSHASELGPRRLVYCTRLGRCPHVSRPGVGGAVTEVIALPGHEADRLTAVIAGRRDLREARSGPGDSGTVRA